MVETLLPFGPLVEIRYFPSPSARPLRGPAVQQPEEQNQKGCVSPAKEDRYRHRARQGRLTTAFVQTSRNADVDVASRALITRIKPANEQPPRGPLPLTAKVC